MVSLLDSPDGVLSLLGNFASAGRLGQPDTPVYGATPDGSPLANVMSPTQQQSGLDALLAFGSAAANAAAPRFGPAPTLMQGLTDALSAGRQQVVNEQVAQAAMAELALKRKILEQQLRGQQLVGGFLTRLGTQDVTSQLPAAAPAAGPAPGYTPGSTVRDPLGNIEGGPRGYQAVNAGGYSGRYQIGSQLAADAGFYVPPEGGEAQNGWGGTFKIPGFEQVKTRDDFLRNPAAQDQAYALAMDHNDKQLSALGLYDGPNAALGRTINGVPVTREGLLAGAWLGGPAGVKAWVDSGGKQDRADSNGTKVSQYVALGAPAAPPGSQQPYQVASLTALPPPSTATGTVSYPGAPDVPVPPGAATAAPGAAAAPPAGPTPPSVPVPPGVAVAPPVTRAATAPAPPAPGVPATPIVMPPIPGMNRGALDQMAPRDKALLGATLLSMPPDKWAPVMAQLAMKPAEAPQITTIGGNQVALYRDGTRVVLGPAHQEPFTVDRLDAQGALHNIRVDPNTGTEQDQGVKSTAPLEDIQGADGQNYKAYRAPDGSMHIVAPSPIPPGSAPLTATRAGQEADLRRAGMPTAEDVFQQKSGEAAAKDQGDLSAAGVAAGSTLQTLRRYREVAQGFQSGKLAPTAATVGSIGQALGLDLGGFAQSMSGRSVSQAEVLQKIGNELVKSQIQPGSGFTTQLSDTDRQFLEKTMPNITNRPESNAMILAFLEQAAQRTIDKSVAWDRNDSHTLKDWRQFNSKWLESQNQAPIIQSVDSVDAANKLAPNSVFRLPDGRMGVVTP